MKKVAFFVGLSDNMGPVTEHTDILFDRVITNVGSGYEAYLIKSSQNILTEVTLKKMFKKSWEIH